MTQPPTWGAPPPQQPGGWPGQPVPGQPGPGGQWGPQQPWPAPVPPKKSGAAKWAIGAVSLVAVIAVTATVAVSCTKNSGDGNGGGSGTKTSTAQSDVASANDTGPVGIITEDPSCAPWTPIQATFADAGRNGWAQRDQSLPATAWTPEMREQYAAVAKVMRKVADQTVPLAKMTTHRAMRELYGQFIVYARAYAESISNLTTYRPIDDNLAQAASTAGNVVGHICSAVFSGAASARASLVPAPKSPTSIAPVGDLSNPQKMFETPPDPICRDLGPTLDQLLQNSDFKKWLNTDPRLPVSSWSPEQESLTTMVEAVMSSTANSLEKLAQQSSNPIVQDFLLMGVQYRRTYIEALPTYQPNDSSIYLAGQMFPGIVLAACDAVSG